MERKVGLERFHGRIQGEQMDEQIHWVFGSEIE